MDLIDIKNTSLTKIKILYWISICVIGWGGILWLFGRSMSIGVFFGLFACLYLLHKIKVKV